MTAQGEMHLRWASRLSTGRGTLSPSEHGTTTTLPPQSKTPSRHTPAGTHTLHKKITPWARRRRALSNLTTTLPKNQRAPGGVSKKRAARRAPPPPNAGTGFELSPGIWDGGG